MADYGMTVARLNFSHGTYDEHEKDFTMIKTLNKKFRKNIKILADLEGHRIRIGELANGKVNLKKGQKLTITNKKITGTAQKISFDYDNALTDVKKGMDIFIDDGNLKLVVLSSKKDELVTQVMTDYVLKEHKGVNIPQAKLKFPLMEEKDYQDMLFALKHGADYVANSFVRNAEDMKPLKEVLHSLKNTSCKLVAKIEDRSGINNLPSILDACDGIMVARGDMGISIPLYTVPIVQKYIIKKCRVRKKFVITATQMLESMVENSIPTRAEVSDVANAIIDGSDYVMLSAETAIGAYPANAVKIMGDIIKFTEKNKYRL